MNTVTSTLSFSQRPLNEQIAHSSRKMSYYCGLLTRTIPGGNFFELHHKDGSEKYLTYGMVGHQISKWTKRNCEARFRVNHNIATQPSSLIIQDDFFIRQRATSSDALIFNRIMDCGYALSGMAKNLIQGLGRHIFVTHRDGFLWANGNCLFEIALGHIVESLLMTGVSMMFGGVFLGLVCLCPYESRIAVDYICEGPEVLTGAAMLLGVVGFFLFSYVVGVLRMGFNKGYETLRAVGGLALSRRVQNLTADFKQHIASTIISGRH